jgi:phosphoribosylaminoimidazolecarboxamide formyltransferase/IMP cyclohydrolase
MNTNASKPMALISVSDKNGIIEFASSLVEMGYGLLSTGGTARAVRTMTSCGNRIFHA